MLIRVWRSVRIDVVGDLLCLCVNWVFVSCGWVLCEICCGKGRLVVLFFFACKMSGNKEAPRILLCGDVNGHLHALYKRVLAV